MTDAMLGKKLMFVSACTMVLAMMMRVDGCLPWDQDDCTLKTYLVKLAIVFAGFVLGACLVPTARDAKDA